MNKKIFYTILGALAVLLIIALLWWWFLGQPKPAPSGSGGFGVAQDSSSGTDGAGQPTNIASQIPSTGRKLILGTGSTISSGGITKSIRGAVVLGPGSVQISGKLTLGEGSTVRSGNTTRSITGQITLGAGSTLSNGQITLGAGSVVTQTGAALTGTITLGVESTIDNGQVVLGAGSTVDGVVTTGTLALGPATVIGTGTVGGQVTLGTGSTIADGTVTVGGVVTTVDSGAVVGGTITLGTVTPSVLPISTQPPITVGTVLSGPVTIATTNLTSDSNTVWLNQEPPVTIAPTVTGSGVTIRPRLVNTVFNPTDINSIDSSNPSGGVIPVIEISDSGQEESSGDGLALTVGIAAAAGAISCGAAELWETGGALTGKPIGVIAVEAGAALDKPAVIAAGAAAAAPTAALSVSVIDLGTTGALSIANSNALSALGGVVGSVSGHQIAKSHVDTFWGCLARTLAKVALNQITNSVVNWINSGFDGTPSFVQDPTSFFQNVADNAAGQYIKSSALSFLCSPFKLQIKIAIAKSYARRNVNECTLTKITSNVKGFMNGNFSNGGWGSLLQFTSVPTNNPYGAFAFASIGLQANINAAVGAKRDDLTLGSGFLSFQKKMNCKQTATPPSASINKSVKPLDPALNDTSSQMYTVCDLKTTTPGKVIADALGATESSTLDSLNLAKSFDEIISALISQLMTKTLQSGLSTLSGSDGYASTYQSADQQLADAAAADLLVDMQTDVSNAQAYGAVQQGSIRDLQAAQKKLNTLYNCWTNAALASTTADRQTIAQDNATSASTTITDLQVQVDAYNDNITKVNTAITTLEDLESRALSAASTIETDAIKIDYDADKAAGTLYTKADTTTAQQDRTTLQSTLADTNAATAEDQRICNAY